MPTLGLFHTYCSSIRVYESERFTYFPSTRFWQCSMDKYIKKHSNCKLDGHLKYDLTKNHITKEHAIASQSKSAPAEENGYRMRAACQ